MGVAVLWEFECDEPDCWEAYTVSGARNLTEAKTRLRLDSRERWRQPRDGSYWCPKHSSQGATK